VREVWEACLCACHWSAVWEEAEDVICLYLPEADLKTTVVIDGVVSRLRV
jgi:hypothetical protein